MALLGQIFRKPQMAGVEGLDLRLHAKRLHLLRHLDQHRRAVRHDVVAMAKIHCAAIQRADLRPAVGDMLQPFGGSCHVGSCSVWRQRCFDAAKHQVATHARCQVQHHIGFGFADAVGDLAEQSRVARRLAGLGIADMTMDDSRAGARRFDGAVGDLRRGDRHLV